MKTAIYIDSHYIDSKTICKATESSGCAPEIFLNPAEITSGAEKKDIFLLNLRDYNSSTLEEIRVKNRTAPIILMVETPSFSILEASVKSNVYDILSFPVIPEAVQRSLKNAVKLKQALDEKEKYKNTLENIINELKQRLEHADRLAAIGNLFAMASHEINNKITSISGNIALLKKLCEKNKYDPQIILEITKRLSCSVQGFSDIIKSVLSFGKTHKNDSKKLISITQCLEQTKIITSILFKKMGIRIIMENETENLFINGIRNEIIHLFINIFINAADAMKDKAHKNFHVKTYSTEKKIIMRFSDSGCGITDISHAEIWEPFYTTKGAAGSGLGLTIAKKIAEKHGGLISASNQAGGEGAVFTLELPKVKIHKLSPA